MSSNICIFTRTSTLNQHLDRQIDELSNYAIKQGCNILKIYKEQISGAKKNTERPQLIDMINYCLSHNVDKVYIHELSRLGRNTIEVLKAVEELNNNKISLYIYNLGIETLTPTKEINPTTKIMVTMLSEFASAERSQTKMRLASGYSTYLKNGGRVGRHKNQTKDIETLKTDHKDIIKYLKQGQSIRNTAKLTGKSTPTVMKIKKIFIDAA